MTPAIDPPAAHTTTPPAQTATTTHDRGDIAIHGLFERGTNAIIDVKIANLDSISYRSQDPDKALRTTRETEETEVPSHL
jgi:hypothetical protein